ncbi:MAG TPA: hypothetical protein VGF85_12330 [Opitutaceae bacterium]|jgi:hypothetical protein
MIAVVSSTVAPSGLPGHTGPRTNLPPELRLEQTRATVDSLIAAGAREIVVADNSSGTWFQERAAVLSPARVIHLQQPPIRNKGIGEIWLMQSIVGSLPRDEPILKISGRYCIGRGSDLSITGDEEVVGKLYPEGRRFSLSTRAYLLRNRDVAERYWSRCLDEIYAQSSRVVGLRSFMRIIRNSVRPEADGLSYSDPNTISLEVASYNAIRHLRLKLRAVENLGVEGRLGSYTNHDVKE